MNIVTDRFEITDADFARTFRARTSTRMVIANPHGTPNDDLRGILEDRPDGVGQPDGDMNVWFVQRLILARTTVHGVQARLPRGPLDLNRSRVSDESFDHERHSELGWAWDAYHDACELLLQEGNPKSVLIDLHGFAEVSDAWAEAWGGGMPSVVIANAYGATDPDRLGQRLGAALNLEHIPTFVSGPVPLLGDKEPDPEDGTLSFTGLHAFHDLGAESFLVALAPWLRDQEAPGPALHFADVMAAFISELNAERYGC